MKQKLSEMVEVTVPNFFSMKSEKETQKVKYKNPKVQKSKRCEIVKFNNRIIQKIEKFKNRKVQICKSVK